jgi:serine protease Do
MTPFRSAAIAAVLAAGAVMLAAAPAPDLQERIYAARDRVMPALVHVEPILEVFRMGEKGRVAVTGSGVIFSPDGYLLTNNHVVDNATRVTCTLSSQEEVQADLIGRDPLTDLAVLRLRGASGRVWPYAELGDSDDLQAGEYVIAMGSPLGLARSLSVGVISSLKRYIPEGQLPSGSPTGLYNTWIQTDAAINPGNSGGPLVALSGRVVGINARAVPIFGENIGFAIPANLALEVSQQLIARGEVTRAWIGAHWQNMKSLTSFFGLGEARGGVLVGSVERGSPAEAAGLKAGDVVLSWNGRPVRVWFEEEIPGFEKTIADSEVGRPVPVAVVRDGHEMQLSITPFRRAKTDGGQQENREWGFTVREITEELATTLGLVDRRGVLVSGVKPGSFAAESGLQERDQVLRLDDVDIDSLEHWSQIYQQAVDARRGLVLITVRRGPALSFHAIRPVYPPAAGGANGSR